MEMKCPSCGAEMVVKPNRKKGTMFWGCSRYPICQKTVDYREIYTGGTKVGIGATVKLEFLLDGDIQEFRIVEQTIGDTLDRTGAQYIQGRKRQSASFDVVPSENQGETVISDKCNLGKALLGKMQGHLIEYRGEDGAFCKVKILLVY